MSSSAEYGEPPRKIGVVSPTRRLNSRATRSGSVARPALGGLTGEHRVGVAHEHDRRDRELRLPSVATSVWPSRQVAAAV